MAECIELEIQKVAAGGDGLASWEGRRVFVPYSLPGELIRARLEPDSGDSPKATILEILRPSPSRRLPECPFFGRCGGCSLQHASLKAQLEIKRGIFAECFIASGLASLPGSDLSIVEGPEYACRNRFQFHGSASGPALMPRSGSQPIPIDFCPLAVAEINDFLASASGSGEGAKAGLAKDFQLSPGERRLVFGSEAGIFFQGRDKLGRVFLGGRELSFPVAGFFQSNIACLEELLAEICPRLAGGDSLADLYGGVGTFSAYAGSAYKRLCLVEENAESIACAQKNLETLGATLDISALPLEDWIKLPAAGRRFDAIVCDPPRTGLSPSVRRYLAASKSPLILYVSCDPRSLARDLASLLQGPYELEDLRAFDFYPQTTHLESLAVLRRKGGRP